MRRRDVITLLGGAAAAGAWPLAARAQQAMPVVGYLNGLSVGDRPHLAEAFRKGLAEVGYAEGRNVAIEYRYADNRTERLRELAAELISRPVSVIVATGGNNPALVAKTLTSTIPIVFLSGTDPVRIGLVASLSRPEGNVTGVSWFNAELSPKQIELLRELLPGAAAIALFVNPDNPESKIAEPAAQEAARAFGLRLVVFKPRTAGEIDAAFDTLVQQRLDAAIVSGDPFLGARSSQFIALAARHRIPLAYVNREFAQAGGLVSYGNSVTDAYRRAGVHIGKILKGTKPADLPVDRATKFELVVNLKTAKALGLTVPYSLLSRADEVIE